MISFPSKWAKSLWENYYYVSIDDINTLSREHLETQGYTITGDDRIDAARRHIKTQVFIPIIDKTDSLSSILDYFTAGAPIDFTSMEDIVEIVEIVGGYLLEWEENLKNTININATPFEKLIKDLYRLHTRLFAMLDDTSFKKIENEKTEPVALGMPLPYNPSGMNSRKEFERPSYEDAYGNMNKIVRDRILSERDY